MARRKQSSQHSLKATPSPPSSSTLRGTSEAPSEAPGAPKKAGSAQQSTSTTATYRQAYASGPQMGSHILLLFVGEAHQLLTLHSDLLAPATQVYLETQFYEQRFCWLQAADPAIVELWRMYLHDRRVSSHDEANDQDAPDDGEEATHADGEWSKLAQAYLFGRHIQNEGFMDACVCALIEKVQVTERFPTVIAREVYEGILPGDKLRELIVDLHVSMGECECLCTPHEDANAPRRFHRDVQQEQRRAGWAMYEARVQLWEKNPCAYHVHGETLRCG